MTPRETDPLDVTIDMDRVVGVTFVPPPSRSAPLIGLLLAALSGALVGGLVVWLLR